jgi:hypothetical protein
MRLRSVVIYGVILAALPLIQARSPAISPDADEALENGKEGEITLASRTQVGDITLERGVYKVQHKTQGTIHLMHFKPVANPREEWTALVECDRDSSRPPAKRTDVTLTKEGDSVRIRRIVVKGERVVYRFE